MLRASVFYFFAYLFSFAFCPEPECPQLTSIEVILDAILQMQPERTGERRTTS